MKILFHQYTPNIIGVVIVIITEITNEIFYIFLHS